MIYLREIRVIYKMSYLLLACLGCPQWQPGTSAGYVGAIIALVVLTYFVSDAEGSLVVIMAFGIFFLSRAPDVRLDPTVEEFVP